MVSMIKRIIFITISILFFLSAIIFTKPVETELMKAFISPHSKFEENLLKLADISSKKINIIAEAQTLDELENLKSEFADDNKNFGEIIDIYKKYPANFLSENKKSLIKNKNYNQLEQEGLEGIYNPIGIYAAPINKDPYLLATDFVRQKLKYVQESDREYEGNFYSVIHREVKSDKEIKDLIEKTKGKSVYLTGSPIHSYMTSTKSNFEINVICLISTLALILLCKFYFKSVKILIPISLSIIFGFLTGFSVCSLIFKKIHILTFVFSTSLIGISLDYSLHYFLTGKEKNFRKSLTSSMITTVLAFMVLLFSNIEVLKQISIFTSFGLFGVWLFVLVLLPMFKFDGNRGTFPKIKIPARVIFVLVLIVIAAGSLKIKFNDNIKNLYVPPKNLLRAEMLYKKVFDIPSPEFVMVSGANTDEIIAKEEKLNLKNSISLSSFVSSTNTQRENINLVKQLYKEDWKNYQKLLGFELEQPDYEIYNPDNFPLKDVFMTDKNTGFIITFEKTKDSINVADEISKIMKRLRKHCFLLLPCVFGVLFVYLSLVYGIKNALKISASPLISVLFTISLISLAGKELDLFNIIALFLVIGFSLDYSIFRLYGSEKSKDAVFMSAFSTAFSFLLLSFTSFKLISSLGVTLCTGITAAYVLSLFMIKSKHETN